MKNHLQLTCIDPQHTPWQVAHKVLYFDTVGHACARGICTINHGQQRYLTPADIVRSALALLAETQQIAQLQGSWQWLSSTY